MRPKVSSELETVSQGKKFRGRWVDEVVAAVAPYTVGGVHRMEG